MTSLRLPIYTEAACYPDTSDVKDSEYKPSNREQAMKAKYGWFPCAKCDRQLVSQVGKCPVCGARENRKKRKLT